MWVYILNIKKLFECKMVALVSQLYFLAVKAINCFQHLQEHSRSYHCMTDLWIIYWFIFRLNINRDTHFPYVTSRFTREFVTGNAELQNYFDHGTNGIKTKISWKWEFVKNPCLFPNGWLFFDTMQRIFTSVKIIFFDICSDIYFKC